MWKIARERERQRGAKTLELCHDCKRVFCLFHMLGCRPKTQRLRFYSSPLSFSFCASQPMDVTRSTIVEGLDVVHVSCRIYLANKSIWKNWKKEIVAVDSRNESTVVRCVGSDVYGFHDYHGHWNSSWPWKLRLIDGNQVGRKRWCHDCHECHILNLCGSFVSIQWLLRSACERAKRALRLLSATTERVLFVAHICTLLARACSSCFIFLPVYYIVGTVSRVDKRSFFSPPFFLFFFWFFSAILSNGDFVYLLRGG